MTRIVTGTRLGRTGTVRLGCSAAVLSPSGDSILLIQRTDGGEWSLPGGGVEPGESITEACEREVREETGLSVKVRALIGVYSDPHTLVVYPDGNSFQIVALHFLATREGGDLQTGEESIEVGYYARSQVDHMPVLLLHRTRIDDTFAYKDTAFIR